MVLSKPEQEKSGIPSATVIQEVGESRMVGSDGPGEPGVCVYFVRTVFCARVVLRVDKSSRVGLNVKGYMQYCG